MSNEIYAEFVRSKLKPGADIHDTMTDSKAHLLHMALGVTTDAGELGDAIKKHAIYGKPLDRENVVEEMGDLRFFMQGICQELNISEREILQHNMDKLNKRYKKNYSDKEAQDRADKQ